MGAITAMGHEEIASVGVRACRFIDMHAVAFDNVSETISYQSLRFGVACNNMRLSSLVAGGFLESARLHASGRVLQ